MNKLGMRLATALVTVCVGIGTVGAASTRAPEPPLSSIGQAAAFVTGTIAAGMKLDMPGIEPGLGTTLLASKKESGAASEAPAEGGVADAAPDAASSAGAGDVMGPPAPEEAASAGDSAAKPAAEAAGEAKPAAADAVAAGTERKLAFIYHSHNRESWLPELKGTGKDQPAEAFDADVNVTLLGERLRDRLEERGVGAVHSDTDYNTAVPSFNYNYSYKYSKTTVREALAVHRELVYLIDIHRDSQRRKQTTVSIDGKDYARLYFIVGQGNPNWKENEALARRLHEALERKFPGLSKGILSKSKKHGNGEYNQSLSSGSLLIEIGGVDNSLEESYRTVDALAAVLAEMAMDENGVRVAGRADGGEAGDAKDGSKA
ncbi:stage II sporulation protein P [Paenibacillus sp.]|uniref:stage II sporulation protein P n=1 Tax=Paenibacillus sp. TaxID=58172 RepID=UPI002D3468F8|nr:stage II sporulation protein P [Paenibacillus sp.]HZG84147.1 stage II sporulation protein P [Paenibacillus sp.]